MALRTFLILLLLALPAWAELPLPGEFGAIDDPRYCGEPERYTNGTIKRKYAVRTAFARVFPCPTSLNPSDLFCEGFAMDHTIPLARGGCDSVANLTWIADPAKSCTAWYCKDRWELRYHDLPRQRIQPEAP